VERFISRQRPDVNEIDFNSFLNLLSRTQLGEEMQRIARTMAQRQEYGTLPSEVASGTLMEA